ncbi:MAG: replicative DNA helicase [Chloroflexota bacterium]|nr:replicative DNA helicase [Chloroflexota bacterium]
MDTPISPSSSNYLNRDDTGRDRRRFGGRENAGFGVATGTGGEKPIPYNAEAEEAVVGSLLIDRDTIIKIAPILRPTDFFSEERAAVYEAILDLYEQRTPGDLITLRDELKRRGKLGEGEGQVKSTSLFSLMHSTPSPVHVEHYAKIVLRYAIMRRLIGAGAQVTALGFDEQLETQEMIDQAQQLIYSVVQEGVKREAVKIGAILEEYFDRLTFLQDHKGDIIGVPSGYDDMDKITGGFQQSDLVILAARPATGKTSLALGIAYNIVMNQQRPRPVGIFSLEMSREQLIQRMLSMETGVDSQRLRTGYIDGAEWDRVSRAFGKLSTAPLYIDDSAGVSIMEMRSRARRLHAEYGIELLIIDYLQLMVGSRNDNRVQEVSEISRNLKGLARELNIPVICLSQLSRAVESRTSHVPQLSDLRESGSIEQDADVVMFIYREEMYNPETEKKNLAEIHIAKHRNGPTGMVPLFFQSKTTRFSNLEAYRQPSR